MEQIIFGVSGAILFLIFAWSAAQKKKSLKKIIKEVSSHYKLAYTGNKFLTNASASGRIRLRGKSDDITTASGKARERVLSITHFSDNEEDHLEIKLDCRIDIGSDFSITNETTSSKLKKVISGSDIQTGERFFDDTILLHASKPAAVIALCSHKVRELIISIVSDMGEIEITRQKILLIKKIEKIPKTGDVIKLINSLILLNTKLEEGGSPKNRLISNITCDPNSWVRRQNINALMSITSIDAGIRELLLSLLNDKNKKVQIEAARHLGPRGMKHLAGMLKKVRPLKKRPALEIIKILTENSYKQCTPALINLYREMEDRTVREIIINTLYHFATKEAHSFLIKELQDPENEGMDINIIKALGTCGTVEAVEPLYKIAKSSLNPVLKNAVQKSIALIQSRIEGVDTGWLSINETSPVDGAMSITHEAGEGALSMKKNSANKQGNKKSKKKRSGKKTDGK